MALTHSPSLCVFVDGGIVTPPQDTDASSQDKCHPSEQLCIDLLFPPMEQMDINAPHSIKEPLVPFLL